MYVLLVLGRRPLRRGGLPFILGHAFYTKAIHGGKTKNDRIDSYKIAALLSGGNLPQAYVYPREMRATRDLLRRRMRFVRKRGGLFSHIQNTITQYNLPPYEERIDQARNRAGLLEHFEDEDVRMSVAANMALLDSYDETIDELELYLEIGPRSTTLPPSTCCARSPGSARSSR